MKPFDRENGHQFIHILFTNKLEQILWLRFCRKGFSIKKPFFDIFFYTDIPTVEAFIQQTAVGYYMRRENNTTFFRHPERLADRPPFILQTVKMIQRPQQQCHVIGMIFKRRQIQGISLYDSDILIFLRIFAKYFDIVLHQLYGVHCIALSG